jgi:hypothetical protein
MTSQTSPSVPFGVSMGPVSGFVGRLHLSATVVQGGGRPVVGAELDSVISSCGFGPTPTGDFHGCISGGVGGALPGFSDERGMVVFSRLPYQLARDGGSTPGPSVLCPDCHVVTS